MFFGEVSQIKERRFNKSFIVLDHRNHNILICCLTTVHGALYMFLMPCPTKIPYYLMVWAQQPTVRLPTIQLQQYCIIATLPLQSCQLIYKQNRLILPSY